MNSMHNAILEDNEQNFFEYVLKPRRRQDSVSDKEADYV